MAVADWDRILAVNLRGMFLVAQAVSAAMVRRGGGVIINMSSTNGIAGEEEYAHYNAAKAGVLLLTKTMALELGQYGIRVNALCPGYISTPLNAAIAAGIGGGGVGGGEARRGGPPRRGRGAAGGGAPPAVPAFARARSFSPTGPGGRRLP